MLVNSLRILHAHRELLFTWTLRDIKIRYKQSVLGAAWAILQPLALMLIFTVVFSELAHLPSDGIPYPVFSYTALLVWTFFASSLSFAIPTIVNNLNLVTKIYFPREILPIASIGAAFFDFVVANALLVGVLAWYHTPVGPALLWLPFLLLTEICLIIGVVLPAAAINVFFRDVRFVVPLAIQLWMYATPVIYPITMIPERFRVLYALNPMVGIVDSYRRVIVQGEAPDPTYLGLSVVVSMLLALGGYIYFKHSEGVFADLI
jgi:lipopolysaccharide transport system permease protein